MCKQLHHTVLHAASTTQSTPLMQTSPNASTLTPQSPRVSMHAATVCEDIQNQVSHLPSPQGSNVDNLAKYDLCDTCYALIKKYLGKEI